MFSTFDHTADIGLTATAPTLPELYAEAARGLTSLFVANLEAIRGVEERTVAITGSEPAYVLFDWLNELLYLFEHEHFVVERCQVSVTDTGLRAICRGETWDRERHQLEHEVKAVTYHELCVEPCEAGWRCTVIFDI